MKTEDLAQDQECLHEVHHRSYAGEGGAGALQFPAARDLGIQHHCPGQVLRFAPEQMLVPHLDDETGGNAGKYKVHNLEEAKPGVAWKVEFVNEARRSVAGEDEAVI